MAFPIHRPRRLRRTAALRDLVRETDLTPRQLVAPLFVKEGIDDPAPIASMPGQAQHTLESLRKEAREIFERGVRAFVLFGVPLRKDAEGSEAWNDQGIVQRGIGALREELGDGAGYQLDPGNGDEALREIRADLDEGADIVMVKPALPYLDVIRRARDEAGAPAAPVHVSRGDALG